MADASWREAMLLLGATAAAPVVLGLGCGAHFSSIERAIVPTVGSSVSHLAWSAGGD